MEQPNAAELAEYAALGIRPNTPCSVLPILDGHTFGPRFVIRRLPVASYPAPVKSLLGNLTPAWIIHDRHRPAWLGSMYTQLGAIAMVDVLLKNERTTRGDSLPWSE